MSDLPQLAAVNEECMNGARNTPDGCCYVVGGEVRTYPECIEKNMADIRMLRALSGDVARLDLDSVFVSDKDAQKILAIIEIQINTRWRHVASEAAYLGAEENESWARILSA